MRVALACAALGLLAANSALANDPQTVYVAPARSVELSLTPAGPPRKPACPHDWYRWPQRCNPDPPRAYRVVLEAGRPLELAVAPAGVYDLLVTLTTPDDKKLTAIAKNVTVGPLAEKLVVPTSGREIGPALELKLRATPTARPDGDICALHPTLASACSSADAEYTCSVKAPNGTFLQSSGCSEAHLYDQLIHDLCVGKVVMKESEFVRRFSCILDRGTEPNEAATHAADAFTPTGSAGWETGRPGETQLLRPIDVDLPPSRCGTASAPKPVRPTSRGSGLELSWGRVKRAMDTTLASALVACAEGCTTGTDSFELVLDQNGAVQSVAPLARTHPLPARTACFAGALAGLRVGTLKEAMTLSFPLRVAKTAR